MSDDLRRKLHGYAEVLADLADFVEVAKAVVADMRVGGGEAPADASLKPSPQVDKDGATDKRDSDNGGSDSVLHNPGTPVESRKEDHAPK